ncbi:MAG: 3D-(3,5/4)-trihydroxycyclohexane-1,2-dione acylhydrolase (decyclizing), partial [Burkholderia sp.]|nr:3D-(3,5/4)-trihydroxycyclohexane-1,2-dione acylhydrolase (decyclizing) [Burkholderia sp.]
MNQRMMDHKREQEHEHGHAASVGGAVREGTIRLTTAQALVRYLAAQRVATEDGLGNEPLFGGVFAIFGHGNVAGMGEASSQHRDHLPTLRAHYEQAMAHSAIAYANAHFSRRMMA